MLIVSPAIKPVVPTYAAEAVVGQMWVGLKEYTEISGNLTEICIWEELPSKE
jgi:hypothetical protein